AAAGGGARSSPAEHADGHEAALGRAQHHARRWIAEAALGVEEVVELAGDGAADLDEIAVADEPLARAPVAGGAAVLEEGLDPRPSGLDERAAGLVGEIELGDGLVVLGAVPEAGAADVHGRAPPLLDEGAGVDA